MRSVIKRRTLLTEFLKANDKLIEIYADDGFDIYTNDVNFYILTSEEVDKTFLWYHINKLYDGKARVYLTTNMHDTMFTDKHIVWRKGTWYATG